MAYNLSDHSISDPVNIYDIQRCFGSSSPDLGTLITNVNINKWAKYKPVRYPNVNTVSQWDFTNRVWQTDLLAPWWKANDGLCGMATTVATEFGDPTSSTSFAYKLINGQLGWTYQRPTGGSTQPYRATDFAHYYGDAIQPYGEIGSTRIYIQNNGQAQIDWDLMDVEPRNLSLSDIQVTINGTTYSLTDFYLGIILWKNNTYMMFTSSNRFGGGSLSIVFDASGTQMPGDWNLMPFFTLNQTNAQGTFDANGGFISMADTTPTTVTLTRDGSNKFEVPEGEWNQAGSRVNFTIYAVNETSAAHTYTTIRVTIYGDSPNGTELGYTDISNTTVAAGQTAQLTGYVTATKSGHSSYWIVVTDLTSGSTIQSKYNQVEDYGGM